MRDDQQADVAAYRDRWYVLGILTIVYALNIADRFSISTLIEPIRQELHLSDSGVAFLTGVALALFYVTIGIPIATLADRANRRRILAIALLLWSAMTALCGLAQNYWQLLLARFGVGIGEAGGTPPSTSMLADKFPPASRPMANTIYALGTCLGAALGSLVAGAVAERDGWRAAFLVLGIPGLLVALLVWLTVREPRRGQLDSSDAGGQPVALLTTLRFIARQRSAVHLILGGSVATFWSWGLRWWTPAFLQRSHHMTIGQAGQLLPWIFVPSVYFYIGPILGLLQNVIPANMRATACAILLFTANVANLILAPGIIGWLSDWFAASFGAGPESLRWALLLLAPTGFWAAWHLWTSGATIREDEARAG